MTNRRYAQLCRVEVSVFLLDETFLIIEMMSPGEFPVIALPRLALHRCGSVFVFVFVGDVVNSCFAAGYGGVSQGRHKHANKRERKIHEDVAFFRVDFRVYS